MAAATMYVTPAGAGAKNGSNWANAMGLAEFRTDWTGATEAGDIYYILGGTYTTAADLAQSRNASVTAMTKVIGVKSTTTAEPPTAADWAYGDDRPYFVDGARNDNFQMGGYYEVRNLRFLMSGAQVFRIGSGYGINLKVVNDSASANQYAAVLVNGNAVLVDCELQSTNGYAINMTSYSAIRYCYIHDSVIGCNNGSSVYAKIESTIINKVNIGLVFGNAAFGNQVNHCVIRGGNSKAVGSIGVDVGTGGYGWGFTHNIITDFENGVVFDDTQVLTGYVDYNDYYDNSTDRTNIQVGTNDVDINPSFTDTATGDFSLSSASALLNLGITLLGTSSDRLNIGTWQPAAASVSTPTFSGITQLEAVGGGCLKASWAAGSGTITGYNVYVRAGSATLFSAAYYKMKVDSSTTSIIFRVDADNATFLTTTNAYYVGIKAENSGVEDANIATLSATIEGDGSTYMKMTDIIGIIT